MIWWLPQTFESNSRHRARVWESGKQNSRAGSQSSCPCNGTLARLQDLVLGPLRLEANGGRESWYNMEARRVPHLYSHTQHGADQRGRARRLSAPRQGKETSGQLKFKLAFGGGGLAFISKALINSIHSNDICTLPSHLELLPLPAPTSPETTSTSKTDSKGRQERT